MTNTGLKLLPREDSIRGLTDVEAEAVWLNFRWPDGRPRCPKCGDHEGIVDVSRPGSRRWRCRHRHDFSLMSATPFASSKIDLRTVLLVISLVQHRNGDKSIRRIADDINLTYKTVYALIIKAQELLLGGCEQKSSMVGYGGLKGGRYQPATCPRAAIGRLLPQKACSDCGVTKSGTEFQSRCGLGADWGLTSSVCRDCKSRKQSATARESWATQKESEDLVTNIAPRTSADILANPRYPGGVFWSTGMRWSPQDRADLATLAAAKVSADRAAAALGRSPDSLVWRARDLLSFAQLPKDWRQLITPTAVVIAPRLLSYPYLPTSRNNSAVSGAELTIAVSALVSRSYPDFMRADICQIVLLAILEGKVTVEDLRMSPEALRAFVRAYRRDQDTLPGTGGGLRSDRSSLDAPRWSDDGDRSGHEFAIPAGVMNRLEW